MLTKEEIKLLNTPAAGFPMLQAASAAWKRCGTCGQRTLKINGILRAAILKYRTNPKFVEHCAELFNLPVVITGIVIK